MAGKASRGAAPDSRNARSARGSESQEPGARSQEPSPHRSQRKPQNPQHPKTPALDILIDYRYPNLELARRRILKRLAGTHIYNFKLTYNFQKSMNNRSKKSSATAQPGSTPGQPEQQKMPDISYDEVLAAYYQLDPWEEDLDII